MQNKPTHQKTKSANEKRILGIKSSWIISAVFLSAAMVWYLLRGNQILNIHPLLMAMLIGMFSIGGLIFLIIVIHNLLKGGKFGEALGGRTEFIPLFTVFIPFFRIGWVVFGLTEQRRPRWMNVLLGVLWTVVSVLFITYMFWNVGFN